MSATLVLAWFLVPQAVPSAADIADSRCLLASLRRADEVQDADKPVFLAGGAYYMGKIVGRSGEAAVDSAGRITEREVREMKADALMTLLRECGPEMMRAIPKR